MMKRIAKVIVVALALLVPSAVFSKGNINSSDFEWEPVMKAIIEVESNGNPNARSGSSCGAMQITPILVRECNQILKRRKSKKRFTLADRFTAVVVLPTPPFWFAMAITLLKTIPLRV